MAGAKAIAAFVQTFVKTARVSEEDIGDMFMYKADVAMIIVELAMCEVYNVKVSTVDAFQRGQMESTLLHCVAAFNSVNAVGHTRQRSRMH